RSRSLVTPESPAFDVARLGQSNAKSISTRHCETWFLIGNEPKRSILVTCIIHFRILYRNTVGSSYSLPTVAEQYHPLLSQQPSWRLVGDTQTGSGCWVGHCSNNQVCNCINPCNQVSHLSPVSHLSNPPEPLQPSVPGVPKCPPKAPHL